MISIRNYSSWTQRQNEVKAFQVTETEPVTEPVTFDDVKDHLRLADDSDQAYVETLIKAARQGIELYTGLALVAKTVALHLNNSEGNFDLPYGPVTGITSVTDGDDVAYTDYEITGFDYQRLVTPYSSVKIAYEIGYEDAAGIPESLKLAIKHEVAFLYANRGDQEEKQPVNSPTARSLAKLYRRQTWLL